MAFKSYIYPYTDLATIWTSICNFMTLVGWTLHDNISDDEKVWKTQGESGTRPVFYIYIKKNGTSNVQIRAYLYWNETAHTGGPYAYSSSIWTLQMSGQPADTAMCCGDKDLVYLATKFNTSTSNYQCHFGFYPYQLSTKYTTLTDGVSAGSNVSLPVVSSDGYSTGMYVQIVGVSGEGRDKLTVASIPDSTHILVSSLPRDYGSGAMVGLYPHLGGFGYDSSTFYALCHPNDVGLTSATNYFSLGALLMSYGNTHPLTGKRQIGPQFVYTSGVALAFSKNTGPGVVQASVGDILFTMDDGSYPITSTVTSATSTVITDTTKSWTPDALIGKYLVISNGTGVNQIKKITDNDATTVTVEGPFAVTPDNTSEYKMVDGVYLRTNVQAWKVIETTFPPTP